MRQVPQNLGALMLNHAVALLKHVRLEVGRNSPKAVQLCCSKLAEILQTIHDLWNVFVVILFLLLVGNIDRNDISVLGIVHLEQLLLIGILGFGFIEMRLGLLTLRLDVLTNTVIFALCFGERSVLGITLLFELRGIIGVTFAQFFETTAKEFERLSDLRNEIVGISVVFVGAGFERRKLGCPCGQGGTGCRTAISSCSKLHQEGSGFIPLKRTGSHGRCVSYTELGGLLVLFLKVLLSKCCKLCAIFLLDGSALSVELLNVFKPANAMTEPCICGFETILVRWVC
ncbi:hypothetical protein HG530_007595 [Fusarium avenaceum]|nr:hypothetical protein HG530_007595 [Fusarium avenaceum]